MSTSREKRLPAMTRKAFLTNCLLLSLLVVTQIAVLLYASADLGALGPASRPNYSAQPGPGLPPGMVAGPRFASISEVAASALALEEGEEPLSAVQKTRLSALVTAYQGCVEQQSELAAQVVAVLTPRQRLAAFTPHPPAALAPSNSDDPAMEQAVARLRQKAGGAPAPSQPAPMPQIPDTGFVVMQILYLEEAPGLALTPSQARAVLTALEVIRRVRTRQRDLLERMRAVLTPSQSLRLATVQTSVATEPLVGGLLLRWLSPRP